MNYQTKRFQLEDLARGACHDGFILGWETGLGKTIAMYLWPILKLGLHSSASAKHRLVPNGAVLMVAPGDLHDQIAGDGHKLFKTVPTVIESQAKFLALSQLNPRTGRRELPPGFYLTTYTALARNGVQPFPKLNLDDLPGMLAALCLSERDGRELYERRGELFADSYRLLAVNPTDPAAAVRKQWLHLKKSHTDPDVRDRLDDAYQEVLPFCGKSYDTLSTEARDQITRLLVRRKHREYGAGIGWRLLEEEGVVLDNPAQRIKCIYDATLADLAQDSFDVTVADEGVRLKSDETIIGLGLRQMNSRYWLITSATPIKNRLPDVFWLAARVTGLHAEPHARFPYPATAEARQEFATEFQLGERNLTREAQDKKNSRRTLTPQIANVHRLWKFVAPLILRRRKADCGEEIVAKHRQVVRVPMGTHQAQTYAYHLAAEYLDCNGRAAIGAKLQSLRMAACNPASAHLPFKGKAQGFGDAAAQAVFRSRYTYIPKLASALNLFKDILEQREQLICFHTFLDSIDIMSARLDEAGVPHIVMDGRTSPRKRGRLASEFKARKYPVMLANSDCMSEGHSFAQCPNVIHYSFPWAMDKIVQSDDRVYRINSPKDVYSFRLTATGSIDMKMEAQGEEKTDAAELVLDGKLLDRPCEELSAAELLQIAFQDFNPHEHTVDEEELLRAWPALREALRAAARQFGNMLPTSPLAIPLLPTASRQHIDLRFADLPLFQLL